MLSGYRLSVSQIGTLFRCPREWTFQCLSGIKSPPTEAMVVGKAFHKLCEGEVIAAPDLAGAEPEYPWIVALSRMWAGWKEATKDLPPTLGCEIKYEDEEIKLYVDEIRAVPDTGDWWIMERKTASKRLTPHKIASLAGDLQLCTYASYSHLLADAAMLEPERFKGIIYTNTLKPLERQGKKETIEDLKNKMTSSTEVYQIPAAKLTMRPKQVEQTLLYARSCLAYIQDEYDAHGNDPMQVPGNTHSCMRWNQPCPHFERCHGKVEEVDPV